MWKRLTRPWLCIALVAGGLGCNQSLFDAHPNPDGGASAPMCPAPCVGDAVAEFGSTQGGTTGHWTYLAEGAAGHGADYTELPLATFGAHEAWSASTDGPAIVRCRDANDAICAGLEDFLVLVPGPGGAGAPTTPALSFRAPETASYRVTGTFRVSDGAPTDVASHILLSRNGKHDATALQPLRTSTTEQAIDVVVNALAGDEIILSVAVSQAVSIGARLFVTRIDEGAARFPGNCLAAVTFANSNPFADSCGPAIVEDLNDGSVVEMTTSGSGASARLGDARVLKKGQYIQLGNSPLDYSGDFTIQFWTKLTEPQGGFASNPYADWNAAVNGGISIVFDSDSTGLDFCFMAHGGATRDECITGTRPVDGGWHFWRVVRSTTDQTLALCLDGKVNVQTTMPATADMTSDEPPRLGRNVVYNPAYFIGSIDDVRVFKAALPCSTVGN